MSLINKIVTSFDAAFIYTFSIVICFLFGLFVGWTSNTSNIKIPYRYGDKVMVKEGFFAGQIGKLTARHKKDDGKTVFSIDFDNEDVKSGNHEFFDDDIILVGDWNQ